jgi:predicted nucleotidyltransferase
LSLPAQYQAAVENISNQLPATLGENLYSCVLFGSAVRGNVVAGVSDINILIVLNQSSPSAHAAIADCIGGKICIDPFIIARKGMERSFAVFAIKFRSIKRNYNVLYGADPIKDFSVSDEKVRFLAEQALRNLRLRSVNTYIHHRHNTQRYTRFLLKTYTALFTYVGEILRLDHIEVPRDYEQRIPIISKYFNIDATALKELATIQANPSQITTRNIPAIYEHLFMFLNRIVVWMEDNW